jgi:ankyrin repeat protein
MSFTSSQPIDLLYDAARRGDVAEIQRFIQDPQVDINTQNGKGFSALILATYDNHIEAAKALIDAGADLNLQDARGNSALMGVSFKGYAACSSSAAPTSTSPTATAARPSCLLPSSAATSWSKSW